MILAVLLFIKSRRKPSKDISRESFPGINSKYYTFVNNEKLFNSWFHNDFQKQLSK